MISAGCLPVLAMVFSSVPIPLCISGGPYLYYSYSPFSPSSPEPTLFWFFMILDAFSISSVEKGVFISAEFMIVGSFAVTAVNMFLKCSVIMLACSFSDPAYIDHIFPVYSEGFLWCVAVYDSYCLIAFIGIIFACFNLLSSFMSSLYRTRFRISFMTLFLFLLIYRR